MKVRKGNAVSDVCRDEKKRCVERVAEKRPSQPASNDGKKKKRIKK